MDIVNLTLLALLIMFTCFFVATEFAMVRIRTSRLDQLIADGNKKAIAAKKVTIHLDEYLSATQLGITVTALGIGWLGEPTVAKLLKNGFDQMELPASLSHILSLVLAFTFITFLNVVVGELAPKSFAIQKAEAVALTLSTPLIWFYRLTFPLIWILNSAVRFVNRLLGLKSTSQEFAHSEEELRIILSESYESGEINQSEYKYVNNIFEFNSRIAKEIMVPRTELVSIQSDASIQEIIETITHEKYTRYPVVDGDKDNVVGVVNIKELLTECVRNKDRLNRFSIEKFTKPAVKVIENIPIHELLIKLQKERSHIAILLDEYGGTAGLVTLEDIIEEIVGEIRDEFDINEIPEVRKMGENHFILNGKVLLSDVNDLLGIHIDHEEIDTIGGWFLSQDYDVKLNDYLEEQGYLFTVKELDHHHILYMDVKKVAPSAPIRS
ncbi:hemolysin family protein [Bacillus sp. 03113]|uniref:hemolysin family protein n=1 Tax=Bacillus sp. 03113 TaxID=2578211 RepID=UPI0011428B6B|nr:hemolysin family protein [Bacillus sp. 03113]